MARLDERLAALADMKPAALRHEWERAYGMPAPRISGELLRMGIAYRLQEKVHGGLSRCSTTALKAASDRGPPIKAGTRLVRSWHGRTVTVEVSENGFVFEDQQYASLSAIAREVTGTNWSGPRFFGLDGKASRG
ncbi:DUF2924 domain-containing protein [Tsuneonella sp. YG55]|uniref:DUF2924 domain-containing protein n=1 Tax=Tsuneonella litorea TaxID=2976475 RepID=A0A9X2VXZ7_9SPHN|nr:DUF2924 domain-containing protein [Tsuneonella litorea]MCT2557360.1 DUF2924 domain-containing protein [Tsuneonella litorea]